MTETLSLSGIACPECRRWLSLQIYHGIASFYLGYRCSRCGPVSRVSGYYNRRADAEADLERAQRGEELTNSLD